MRRGYDQTNPHTQNSNLRQVIKRNKLFRSSCRNSSYLCRPIFVFLSRVSTVSTPTPDVDIAILSVRPLRSGIKDSAIVTMEGE